MKNADKREHTFLLVKKKMEEKRLLRKCTFKKVSANWHKTFCRDS